MIMEEGEIITINLRVEKSNGSCKGCFYYIDGHGCMIRNSSFMLFS